MGGFDFDAALDRRATPALKTHPLVVGEDGAALFAAGVADMDFAVAPQIQEALRARLDHPVFGYETVPGGLIPALRAWLDHRHAWAVAPEHILRAPNALNALAISAALFSGPGDGIIVQPPVFFDFFDIIAETPRRLVSNPLILRDGRYELDFTGLEAAARDPSTKLLFLCNPHNPVGRVWSRAELARLSEICARHGVLVVADELHGDIVFPGHAYVPFASLGPEAAQNSVTILSPAKAFNIASCCCAFTIIPNDQHRAAIQRENSRLTVNKNNAFANVAMEAAYREGGPWLDAAIRYIAGNLAVLRESLRAIPGVRLIEPEGTFLVWLDFAGLGLPDDALHRFLRRDARWAVTRGTSFGPEGAGFMRLNIACRRQVLVDALRDLGAAVRAR